MPRLSSVLLLDGDPKGLEALSYGFESEGVRAASAATVAAAIPMAREAEAQIVVATLRQGGDAMLDVLAGLAGAEETRSLPLLVLAPEALKPEIQGLAHEAAVLPLPVFARDVITAARVLGCTTTGADGSDLHGMLSDYGLFFLARTMMALGRSGIVQLERANRKGEVRFADGEIVGAQVGSLQGQAALHHLLVWEEAAMDVKFRGGIQRGPGFPKGAALLDEMERFMRDFKHAIKDLGSLQALYVQDAENVANQPEATRTEVMPVLKCFDGQRTLGEVLEDSPFRAFDTLRVITRLVEMGALRRKALERPSGAAAGPRAAGDRELGTQLGAGDVHDQRTGPASRRKSGRKGDAADDHGRNGAHVTPAPIEVPGPTSMSASAAPEPAAPVAAVIENRSGEKSGEMKARGEFRATRREVPVMAATQPSMVIDLGSLDPHAGAPPAPAPAAAAPAPTARASGVHSAEIAIRPSRPMATAAPAGPSIQIDPHLSAASEPAPAAQAAPPAAAAPVAPPAPAPAAPAAHPPAQPAAAAPRRPSGEFNALEADFFAREADLYKSEPSESFDDLDRGRGPRRR